MKKLLFTLSSMLLLISFAVFAETKNPAKSGIFNVQTDYGSGIKISQAQFDALTSSYQTAHPTWTQGGTVSKNDVQALLNSMPDGAQFVNFRFCTDAGANKISMALCGAKTADEPESEIKCLRNGGSDVSFCPTACNPNVSSAAGSIGLAFADYNALSNAYQTAYPSRTQGGNIDKSALMDILNSIPAGSANMSFRFCTDAATNKMSVIFIGGATDSGILYIRNGLNADSFCPTNCNRN